MVRHSWSAPDGENGTPTAPGSFANGFAEWARASVASLATAACEAVPGGNSAHVALVLHLLNGDRSWRFEASQESKLDQALGAKARHAISDYKRSTDDAKWVLVAYDDHGAVAAVDRSSLDELKGKLGDFPDVKQALENV